MSKKGYLEDSDCDGEVDFDFFDSPKDPPRSKLSPKESKNDPMETKHAKPESVPVSDSSDSERSGPVTRASVKKIEATVPVLTTASHDYSDSFESDSAGGDESEEDAKPKSKPELKKNARVSQKKAWESSERWKSATAKSENHSRSTSNGKSKPPPKSKSRKSDHIRVISDESSEISTDSDTDSDVTEVSPLGSPRTRNGHDMYDMRELAKLGKPPRSPMHKETVSYHKPTRPTSAKTKESNKLDKLLNADSDSMDLQLLMQAVLEMEQDREKRQRQQRRVLFAPPPKAKPQSKLNQTFSNDKVRTIDRENQRLMQRIMGMAKEAEATKTKIKKPKYAHREPPKLTPSAVNRLSEQRRIERENLAMLKRLQTTRATKDLQRDKLLTNYNSTMIAGHSVAEVHQQGKLRSPYESRSATSISGIEGAGAVGTSPGKRTRPTSAKSSTSTASMRSTRSATQRQTRPQSGKRAVATRPEWESGW